MEMKPNNPAIIIGALIVIAAAIIFLMGTKADTNTGPIEVLEIDKSGFAKAPELRGLKGYINTDETISLASLKGKVVLVDFWTYSCINCIRTLPYLKSWHEKYGDKGLVIIGVHSPEFDFEKDFRNVQGAVEKNGIEYPIVLDNDFATWRAYNNHYWPHKYLIDSEGYIRYDHIGEGGYEETEDKIVELLMERDAQLELGDTSTIEAPGTVFGQIGTPEIYFGHNFFRLSSPQIGNTGGFSIEKPADYTLPGTFQGNTPYLEGTWETRGDYSIMHSENGKVALRFKAKNANIVAGSPNGSQIKVMLDGSDITQADFGDDVQIVDGRPTAIVREQRLYNLVSGQDYSEKTLVFEIIGEDFELYTFTFG